MPMLKELGVISKTKFHKECEDGITLDELNNRLTKHIESLPWKK